MIPPLIGISASHSTNSRDQVQTSLGEVYSKAIAKAGGLPVIIPLGLESWSLQPTIDRLDGMLFSGGGDILPQQYGNPSHPLVNWVDEDRDCVELTLFEAVLQKRMPFLGICRGLQLVNVGLGGTLYEDICDQYPQAKQHQSGDNAPREVPAHTVKIMPNSRLASILGIEICQVNSFHHQGIRILAPGLVASAHAPDGIIEAVELHDYPFGLAVQWHPEWMPDDPFMQSLFQAFIKACARGDSKQ